MGAVVTTAWQRGDTSASVWIGLLLDGDPQLICRLLLLVARTSRWTWRRDATGSWSALLKWSVRPCAFAVALRVEDVAATIIVYLRRSSVLSGEERLERVFRAAQADRYVFAREDEIRFRWPSKDEPGGTFDDATHMTARLCSRSGRIYVETDRTALAGDAVRLCHAYQQIGGAFDLVLMPGLKIATSTAYRISRAIPLWSLGNNRYTESSTDTLLERRREALVSAARCQSRYLLRARQNGTGLVVVCGRGPAAQAG